MLRPSLGPQKFIWIFLLKELRRFTSLLSAPALPFWKRILSSCPFPRFSFSAFPPPRLHYNAFFVCPITVSMGNSSLPRVLCYSCPWQVDPLSLGRWPNEQCGGSDWTSVFRFSQMVVGKIGWRTTLFRLLRFFHMSYITLVPRQLLHPMLGLFSSSSLSCLPAANLLFPHQHLRKNFF